jgi:flagellar biosynthesis protein FliR
VPTDGGQAAVMIVTELAIGLAFAFGLAVLQAAIQAGAALVDAVVGFSFAAIVDPINGQQSAVLNQFYGIVATMIFLAVGGDQLMIMGLARSYGLMPLGSVPDVGALSSGALDAIGQLFVIGLEITAPALIALVVTDAALGVVSRAMPQMNVFVVGLPAKLIAAFAVIAASLPFMAMHLQDDLQGSVMQALQLLKVA